MPPKRVLCRGREGFVVVAVLEILEGNSEPERQRRSFRIETNTGKAIPSRRRRQGSKIYRGKLRRKSNRSIRSIIRLCRSTDSHHRSSGSRRVRRRLGPRPSQYRRGRCSARAASKGANIAALIACCWFSRSLCRVMSPAFTARNCVVHQELSIEL